MRNLNAYVNDELKANLGEFKNKIIKHSTLIQSLQGKRDKAPTLVAESEVVEHQISATKVKVK